MATLNFDRSITRRTALAGLGAASFSLALSPTRVGAAQDSTPPAADDIVVVPFGRGLPTALPGFALSLNRVTFPVGVGDMPHTHPGAALVYIESGTMAMTALVGQPEVTRAGSTEAETVALNTEVMLHPGDAVFFPDEHGDVNLNVGNEPLVFLVAGLYAADQPSITFMATPAP